MALSPRETRRAHHRCEERHRRIAGCAVFKGIAIQTGLQTISGQFVTKCDQLDVIPTAVEDSLISHLYFARSWGTEIIERCLGCDRHDAQRSGLRNCPTDAPTADDRFPGKWRPNRARFGAWLTFESCRSRFVYMFAETAPSRRLV